MATAASRTLDAQQQARPEPFEIEVLDSFACTAPLCVTGVSLMAYAAGEIGGPLMWVADYALDGGDLRWNEWVFGSKLD
jgi:hypothetical protein